LASFASFENAAGAVPVLEVAALGRPAPHQEQGGDREAAGQGDDQDGPDQVHALSITAAASRGNGAGR
jgi:hypothetical protein